MQSWRGQRCLLAFSFLLALSLPFTQALRPQLGSTEAAHFHAKANGALPAYAQQSDVVTKGQASLLLQYTFTSHMKDVSIGYYSSAVAAVLPELLSPYVLDMQLLKVSEAPGFKVDDDDVPVQQPHTTVLVRVQPRSGQDAKVVADLRQVADSAKFADMCGQLGLQYVKGSFKAAWQGEALKDVTVAVSTGAETTVTGGQLQHATLLAAQAEQGPGAGDASRLQQVGTPEGAEGRAAKRATRINSQKDELLQDPADDYSAADEAIDAHIEWEMAKGDPRAGLRLRGGFIRPPNRVADSQGADMGSLPASTDNGHHIHRVIRIGNSKPDFEAMLAFYNSKVKQAALSTDHMFDYSTGRELTPSRPGREDVRANADLLQEALHEVDFDQAQATSVGTHGMSEEDVPERPQRAASAPSIKTLNVVVTESEKYHRGSNFWDVLLWASAELMFVLVAVLVFMRWQGRRHPGPSYAELKFRVEALEAQLSDAKRDAAAARSPVIKHATL